MDLEVKGTRVLIVDDAATMRSMLRNFLLAQGYDIVGQLASGNELLQTIVKTMPEIVCLDHHLPGSNGLELLQQITAAYPQVAVVMITGTADADFEDLAADAGAAGFIRKPFSPTQLVRELRQVVRAKHTLAAMRTSAASTGAQRGTAVIADDSATMRGLLTSILSNANIEVVSAVGDGQQALAAVKELRPDFICLDWDMPVMNGLEALRAIRSQQPDAKVLMITARATREAILQANQAGAKGYILKPFSPDKVISAIEKLLA